LNALDELAQGGRININVARDVTRGTWAIEVADTGHGLSPELLVRVFEPFASSKETGTGLGLPICKRIVEAHGGTIEAANSKQGAVFTVRLPFGSLPMATEPSACGSSV
jgi:signal transduction histidine kinase